MPKFKGGDAKLMEFIMMNMKYPESAIKAKQQGRAIVGFVVRKDGTVSDVYIESQPDMMCLTTRLCVWLSLCLRGNLANKKASL